MLAVVEEEHIVQEAEDLAVQEAAEQVHKGFLLMTILEEMELQTLDLAVVEEEHRDSLVVTEAQEL
jgi:hypothetical protein